MADMQAIADALMAGKRDDVKNQVQQAIDEGVKPEQVLNEGLVAGMAVIGRRFKANEIYVPEVLIAARAMHAGLEILEPLLAETGVQPLGRAVLGTVKGDLHDIGKNLVGMMLRGGAYEVIDLGTDVSAEQFVEAAREKKAQLICMSALLTTTMPYMGQVVQAVKEAGLNGVKTVIGGAPVTQQYADDIGADGYAPDAASAVEIAQKLIGAA